MQFFSRYSYIWKFDNPLERDYSSFVTPANLTSLRLVSFITLFGMSIFSLIDLFKEVDYSIVIATRVFVLLGASVVMFISYRRIGAATIAWCVVVIVVLNLGAALTTATYAGMPSYYITNLLFLIFVLVITASGLNFRHALWVNTFSLVTFIIYAQLVNKNPFYYSQYPHLFSIFIYIHIVGIVLESRRRKNFLQFNDLMEQKRLVEELNQQKNKVISILSHDVATPMSSLSNILHLQATGQINENELKPFINGLSKEINNVSFLLNGLVRWSRSQMQGFVLNKSNIDVVKLILDKKELFHLQLVEKSLSLEWEVPPIIIKADEEMMRISLRNLISNAIRFANNGTRIYVDVSVEGSTVLIRVKNKGKSIPDDLRNRLFTYQMPSMEDTNGEKGAGLGLAMAAFFIRLHGGDIYLDTKETEVTCFCISLPQSVTYNTGVSIS